MVVYVDVDDTLVRTAGTKRIPMPRTIDRVRELHADGHELYLWSTGGGEYARESAVELGIEGLFSGFLPKPKLYIDDQEFGEWRGLVYERP
jgi:hydroxymethylpyrimidine pyrophosphatase-like HAD family hydrolase